MHILITGGSRGIGAEAVRFFTAQGHRVRFFYHRSRAQAETLARETGAEAVPCDVADPEAVNAGLRDFGPVDVLINNAAIAHYGLINQIGEETWNRLFAVNVNGVYHCVNAVLPGMLRNRAGCIINLASMWGQVGASCEVAYSAAKAGVIGLTKALAKEVGPSGITVNCVAPGLIETEMNRNLSPETKAALAEETPLERLGTPEDVAQAIWFLASPAGDFFTGQVLAPNGGWVI